MKRIPRPDRTWLWPLAALVFLGPVTAPADAATGQTHAPWKVDGRSATKSKSDTPKTARDRGAQRAQRKQKAQRKQESRPKQQAQRGAAKQRKAQRPQAQRRRTQRPNATGGRTKSRTPAVTPRNNKTARDRAQLHRRRPGVSPRTSAPPPRTPTRCR